MKRCRMGTFPNGISLVINQTHNMRLYDSTVQRWADHYVALVEKYAKTLRPRVGRVWSCDEKFTLVAGAAYWWYTVRNLGTRFILSWHVAPKKTNYDAKDLFEAAAKMAGHCTVA